MNFVFIYTDDQRYDGMSVVQKDLGEKGRFPWISTPNMDRLAQEGVRFRNAFVVNSLCSPSRASFLTGTYGYRNGIVNNHTEFPLDSVTYATLLHQAGYTTGYIGKWHMGKQVERPGFDYYASYIGQGHYMDMPFSINGTITPTQGWVDDISTGYAIQFLRDNKDKPFELSVGFKSPHGPPTPPPRFTDFFSSKEKSRTVPSLGLPPVFFPDAQIKPTPPGGWISRPIDAQYFSTVHAVDEDLGKILDELDKLGLAENTMVIYTSDNGLFRGEHQLDDKRAAYEESMRVPMLVRYPKLGIKGKLVDQDVLYIDIAETMLDYAGVKIPAEMQGRSWRPLLEGQAPDWRRAFFYSYYVESEYPRLPTMMAVRNGSAKLTKYSGHDEWTELFDLKNDPNEVKNLIHDPESAGLLRRMEALYDQEAKAIAYEIPSFVDNPAASKKSTPDGKKKKAKPSAAPAAKPSDEGE